MFAAMDGLAANVPICQKRADDIQEYNIANISRMHKGREFIKF